MPPLRLQIRTTALLAATRVLLHRRGTTSTLVALTRWPAGRRQVDPGQALRATRRAGRVLGGTCLAQSVALTAVLEGAGRHPTLILGARREGGQSWTAHAWVVVDEQVLEPVRGEQHNALARLDATSGWVPTQPTASP